MTSNVVSPGAAARRRSPAPSPYLVNPYADYVSGATTRVGGGAVKSVI
ncbi:hypothetical protein [Lentzea californiensis]|nr:hypothetical protein [Lentzea californiensis]MCR3750792.1 hypothetical protein [Lentzea californiensis]